MKLPIRLTPVSGFDPQGLAAWLEEMAAGGLRFSMTLGLLTCFEKAAPAAARYHLEPCRVKADGADPELVELYGNMGWRYLGQFRKNYAVFLAESEEAEEPYTDETAYACALDQFFRRALWGLAALAAAHLFLIPPFWRVSRAGWDWVPYLPVYAFASYALLPALCAFCGLFFADYSYFAGLWALARARKRARAGVTARPRLIKASGGRAAVVAAVLLALAGLYLIQDIYGFKRWPVEETSCVSLLVLEPEADLTDNVEMEPWGRKNEVSRQRALMLPTSWRYRQGGWSKENNHISLEVDARRFLLPALAEKYLFECAGTFHTAHWPPEEAVALPRADTGLNQALFWTDGLKSGLWLRKGRTVLNVRYTGEADLSGALAAFSAMMDRLP